MLDMENMHKQKEEIEKQTAGLEAIMKFMCEVETDPKHKAHIKALLEGKKLTATVHRIMESIQDDNAEAVLEYFQLVQTGLQTFIDTTLKEE
jgi:hypothetical protein